MNTPTPTPQSLSAGTPTFEEILEQHVRQRFDEEKGKLRCSCGEQFPANPVPDRSPLLVAGQEHIAHVTQVMDEHFPLSSLDRAALHYRIHVPAYSSSNELVSSLLRGRVNTR